MGKVCYKIKDVAAILEVPVTTLRWWESEIESFSPQRTPSGQRRYTPEDLETARKIKALLKERGLSIEAAARQLRESVPPRRRPRCRDANDAVKLLGRLGEIVKDNPKALLMIESVEKYLKQNLM
ncbi:MAG: MerR family transcriptional regulator [Muribaculaceae bacterium]|nr:MerR family transcriptional regulator [Muribaculaceae bacterium]